MAKKKDKKTDEMSNTQKVSVGISLTAAVAAAAGTYFLYGSKEAKKNRKKAHSWMLKAKGEVLERIEGAKEMSRDEYEDLLAGVLGAYAGIKSASKTDISTLKDEMMDHWESIEKLAKPKKKAAKKPVKKTAKKTPAKKVVKKATKAKAEKVTKKKTKK